MWKMRWCPCMGADLSQEEGSFPPPRVITSKENSSTVSIQMSMQISQREAGELPPNGYFFHEIQGTITYKRG